MAVERVAFYSNFGTFKRSRRSLEGSSMKPNDSHCARLERRDKTHRNAINIVLLWSKDARCHSYRAGFSIVIVMQ